LISLYLVLKGKKMSADNYVVVRKFGENDFRWAMFFASDDDYVTKDDKCFIHGIFKTPREAANNAQEELGIIEYGIEFEDGCLKGDPEF
jgi:hypothetical protein